MVAAHLVVGTVQGPWTVPTLWSVKEERRKWHQQVLKVGRPIP